MQEYINKVLHKHANKYKSTFHTCIQKLRKDRPAIYNSTVINSLAWKMYMKTVYQNPTCWLLGHSPFAYRNQTHKQKKKNKDTLSPHTYTHKITSPSSSSMLSSSLSPLLKVILFYCHGHQHQHQQQQQ